MTVHADGSLTLEFDAQSEEEVIAWVMGFGSAARVLAPKRLRERMLGELEAAARSYAQPSADTASDEK